MVYVHLCVLFLSKSEIDLFYLNTAGNINLKKPGIISLHCQDKLQLAKETILQLTSAVIYVSYYHLCVIYHTLIESVFLL